MGWIGWGGVRWGDRVGGIGWGGVKWGCHYRLSKHDLLTCKMTNTIASTVRFVVVCYHDSGKLRHSPLLHRPRSKPLKGFWKCVHITMCFVKLIVQLPSIKIATCSSGFCSNPPWGISPGWAQTFWDLTEQENGRRLLFAFSRM